MKTLPHTAALPIAISVAQGVRIPVVVTTG